MSKLIVKDNDFIEASLNLDVVEQRIIFLAIIKARQNSDNVEETLAKEFVIHASEYVEAFNVERHTAYESLKNGVQGLLDAKFLYRYENKNNNLAHRGYNLTSWVEYVDHEACVTIKFSTDVVPLIVGLNKKFTTYELQQIVNLQSRYAIRLYELLIRWRDTRKLNISLEDLKFCLGIHKNEYQLMSNFKNRVLDLAVTQINKYTDIVAEYVQKKEGRKITGFEFTYTIKERPKPLKIKFDSVETKAKRGRPKKVKEDVISINDTKLKIAKSKADEYIQKKQIDNEAHKANIYRTAQVELWGVNEQLKAGTEDNLQNLSIDKNIGNKDLDHQMHLDLIKDQALANEMFIQAFESFPIEKQLEILDHVQGQIKNVPIIGNLFIKARKEFKSHKDLMYRQYFKNALKDFEQIK